MQHHQVAIASRRREVRLRGVAVSLQRAATVAPLLAMIGVLALPAGARASEESERLYSRGLVEFHAGNYAAALPYLDRAVAADGSDALALYYRAATQSRLQNYQLAIRDLEQALRLRPDFDEAALELGIARLQAEDYPNAIVALQRARRSPSLDAKASLFLGLAQLRTGQLDAARQSFEHAAVADPSLHVQAHYYQGVVAYQMKGWSDAQRHFEAVTAAGPNTDMGREAAAFLKLLSVGEGPERPYAVYGAVGMQYDSNVALAGEEDLGVSNQDDGLVNLTAGGVYRPLQTDAVEILLGYEFFQSLHFNLHSFDVQDHRPEVHFVGKQGPLRFGLLARYEFMLRDSDAFLHQVTGLPWLLLGEGDFGRTESYYRVRFRSFEEGEFKDRDVVNQAPGIRQFFYLGAPERFFSVGYQFDREDPNRSNNNAERFAYDGQEFNASFGWLLPADVAAQATYAYRRETYPKNSLAVNAEEAFPSVPLRDTSEGRLDKVHEVAVVLQWPFLQYFELLAGYYGTFNGSNDPIFDYNRHIASLAVQVSF
jgi:tetratricopeptide (TPR) repeat protein